MAGGHTIPPPFLGTGPIPGRYANAKEGKVMTAMNPATIKEAKELIKRYYKHNIPVYLWGPPGSAKSAGSHQVTEELKIGFIDIRLGSKLPEDLNGIPVPDLEHRLAIWLKASFWPDVKRDGEKGIIMFDEMSDPSKAVESVTYQIVFDRCIVEF